MKWQCALVERVDLSHLRGMRIRGQRQIGITTRLGQDLHLLVHPASAAASRVRQRPVAVDKGVTWWAFAIPARQAAQTRKAVSEFYENSARVLGSVGGLNAMVQVDLDLTPARAAVLGQAVDQGLVVLLGWIEVGVTHGATISVTPTADGLRILRAPLLKTTLLLIHARVCFGLRRDRWFEVIGHSHHDVDHPRSRRPAQEPLPTVDW